MPKDKEEQFSDWQFGRIRARLLAYYYFHKLIAQKKMEEVRSLKQKKIENLRKHTSANEAKNTVESEFRLETTLDYSWLSVVYAIIDNEETDFDDDQLNSGEFRDRDKGLSLKEETIRKMCNGYERGEKNKPKYWTFSKPKNYTLAEYKNFLIDEGYLTENDLLEPDNWPSLDKNLLQEQLRSSQIHSKRIFQAYEGDYHSTIHNGKLTHDKYFTFSMPTIRGQLQKKPLQALLVRNNHFNEDNEPISIGQHFTKETQKRFWGWFLMIAPDIGLVYLRTVKNKFPLYDCYLLHGTNLEEDNFIREFHIKSIILKGVSDLVFKKAIEGLANKPEKVIPDLTINAAEELLTRLSEPNLTNFLHSTIIMNVKPVTMGFAYSNEERHEAGPLKLMPLELEGLIFGSHESVFNTQMGNTKMRLDSTNNPAPDYVQKELSQLHDAELIGKRLQWVLAHGSFDEFCSILDHARDQKVLRDVVNYKHEVSGATVLHIAGSFVGEIYLAKLLEISEVNYLIKDNDGQLPSEVALEEPDLYKIGELLVQKEVEQANRDGVDYKKLLTNNSPSP